MIHSVYFYLNSTTPDAKTRLIEGIELLRGIESVKNLIVGQPAATPVREVVDASYGVSLLVFFDSIEDHNTYQDHSLHHQFVDEYQDCWSRVQIYDSTDD